jgi:hypothetical protein
VKLLDAAILPLVIAAAGCATVGSSSSSRDGSAVERAIIIAPPPTTADAREWIEIRKRYPDAKPLKSEPARLEWRTTSQIVYRSHIIDSRRFSTSEGHKTMYFDVTSAVTAQ